jgi:hypothetical protein
MRYNIRRISLSRVALVGCALGWLAILPPAFCMAGVVVILLQRAQQALQQIQPFTLNILGQEVARIDWLEILHLQPLVDRLAQWSNHPILSFIVLTLTLTIIGSVLVILIGLLVSGAYNLLSRTGWGLVVELSEEPLPPHTRS